MKKTFNRIKTCLATLWIAVFSFFSKVFWQSSWGMYQPMQEMYGVEYTIRRPVEQPTLIETITKLAKWPLIGITFIVWIISFIKIRKIEDKAQKKKKIKRIIIIISILVVLIVASLILPLLLKK